jgi:hypothetical protein
VSDLAEIEARMRAAYRAAGWRDHAPGDAPLTILKHPAAPGRKAGAMTEADWSAELAEVAQANGGGYDHRMREYLAARAAELDDQATQIARNRAAVRRERRAVRTEWRLVTVAWVLLVLTTGALCAGWPALMDWADMVWRTPR